jgi:ubiquinone/menaquinone biosynthesis C-methylase UbiE
MTPVTHAVATAPAYALGHSDDELDRLVSQARFLGDLTEHVLHLAGIERGMRVLDIGCGAGDVTFLAARLVGETGTVIGIDNASDAIEVARSRASAVGLSNVEFRIVDATTVVLDEPVDAIVGRLILMYFADPAAVLRGLMRSLRPGWTVMFQELDAYAIASEPHCPIYEAAVARIRETLTRAGSDPRAGLKLCSIFQRAGLSTPQMLQMARVEAGADTLLYSQVAAITRTLLPAMERMGVATAADVAIDTLADQLRAEAVERGSVLVFPPLIGAWTRKPIQ